VSPVKSRLRAGIFSGAKEGVQFGPLMSALAPRQQAWVLAMFATGTWNATAAVRTAGYRGNSAVMKVQAWRLVHSPKVQAAMQEYGRSMPHAYNPLMVKNLIHLATKAKKEEVRLRATLALLNRGGLLPLVDVRQRHEAVVTYDEKLMELQRLARLNGDDSHLAIAGLPRPPGHGRRAEAIGGGGSANRRAPAPIGSSPAK
jgi:hypothetical protein